MKEAKGKDAFCFSPGNQWTVIQLESLSCGCFKIPTLMAVSLLYLSDLILWKVFKSSPVTMVNHSGHWWILEGSLTLYIKPSTGSTCGNAGVA